MVASIPSRSRQPAPGSCVPVAFGEMMQVKFLIVRCTVQTTSDVVVDHSICFGRVRTDSVSLDAMVTIVSRLYNKRVGNGADISFIISMESSRT